MTMDPRQLPASAGPMSRRQLLRMIGLAGGSAVMYQVLNQLRPTAEGDYIQRINSIDFRDDGTVYFLAGTVDDDLVLYEARPIF